MNGEHVNQEWGQRGQHGHDEVYGELCRDYRPMVQGTIHQRLHLVDDEDRKDLEQQVWIAVWKSLPSFRGNSAFSTWIVGITRNVIFSWLRHRLVEQQTISRLLADVSDATQAESEFDVTNRIAVQEAVRNLVETEQQVIRLRYFEALTDAAVADRLRIPLGTVKGRIRAALTHLRETL